jgi:uncharacterized protein (TIGR03118 family)
MVVGELTVIPIISLKCNDHVPSVLQQNTSNASGVCSLRGLVGEHLSSRSTYQMAASALLQLASQYGIVTSLGLGGEPMSRRALRAATLAGAFALILSSAVAQGNRGQGYVQKNLVSDLPSQAPRTDPNLVNPWGIAIGDDTAIWVANNATGTSTIYFGNGRPSPLVVAIPSTGGSPGTPTGIVYHETEGEGEDEFVVNSAPGGPSGPSVFLFANLDGAISGWSPAADRTHAILGAQMPGAVYTGLAIAETETGSRLYAANFPNAVVDVFDADFNHVVSFSDPSLVGYGPFGIQEIDGRLYVAFAKIGEEEEETGPGLGYIDVFDTEGNLLTQLVSQGALNAPWGLALAPRNFGAFSNALLVGNFGDGRINAYDSTTGEFLGTMTNHRGNPIEIEGLWGIAFGNGTREGGRENTLFFAAGIDDEEHGLFGRITTRSNAF